MRTPRFNVDREAWNAMVARERQTSETNRAAIGLGGIDLNGVPAGSAYQPILSGRSRSWYAADVYFAHSCDREWLVKIGASIQPRQRLSAVRAPSGARAELMAVLPSVGSRFERWLHWYFEGLRVEGEWFTPWPPLLDLIDRVNGAFPLGERVAT